MHPIFGLGDTKEFSSEEALAIHFFSNNDSNNGPFQ